MVIRAEENAIIDRTHEQVKYWLLFQSRCQIFILDKGTSNSATLLSWLLPPPFHLVHMITLDK